MTLTLAGCVSGTTRPGLSDLRTKDGRERAVVLVRLATEIDGQKLPAFSAVYPQDAIWLGLGGFSSGGRLEIASLRFFSKETRLDGWAYLLLEPGVYYLSPHAPQNENAFAYDHSWRQTRPHWRFTVPPRVPVVYIGTLFVPGTGQGMIFGGRRLRAFDEQRFEASEEGAAARAIHEAWLSQLGPLTTKLVQPHPASEPIILETPPGR